MPSDYVFVPAPVYANAPVDFEQRAELKSYYVHTDETESDGRTVFRLTVDKIAAAYEEALEKVTLLSKLIMGLIMTSIRRCSTGYI